MKKNADRTADTQNVSNLSVSEKLYDSVSRSTTAKIFTSYSKENAMLKSGLWGFLLKKNKQASHLESELKKKSALQFEKSKILKFISNVFASLLRGRLRTYGLFGFTFSVYVLISYFVKLYLADVSTSLNDIIFFALFGISSLILTFSGDSLANKINNGRILRRIAVDFLGISEESLRACDKTLRPKPYLAIMVGMISGMATYVIPPFSIISSVFLLIAVALVFSIPETGVIMLLTTMPFISLSAHADIVFVLSILIISIGYAIKLIRNKRIISFGLIDYTVLAFLIMVLMGGFVSFGNTESVQISLKLITIILSYFIIVNLLRSEIWLKRSFAALAFSSLVMLLVYIPIAIYSFAFASEEAKLVLSGVINYLPSGLKIWGADYIAATSVVFLLYFHMHSGFSKKILWLIAYVVSIVCVGVTVPIAAMAMLLGLIAFLLLVNRKNLTKIFVPLISLPTLIFVTPNRVMGLIQDLIGYPNHSIYTDRAIRSGALNMLEDVFFYGIGVGNSAFSNVFPIYSSAGVALAVDSCSLYLQITLETGIISLILFLLILFFFAQLVFEYMLKSGAMKDLKVMSIAGLSGVLILAAMGVYKYVWSNTCVMLSFWVLIAIGVAAVRIGNENISIEQQKTEFINRKESREYIGE